MLGRIFYSMGIRMVMGLVFMGLAGIASLGSHSKDANASSAKNPWSKDHVASTALHSPSDTASPQYRWVDKQTGKPATQEQIEDEAYRRQLLHEARENYERDHGPVDTSEMED